MSDSLLPRGNNAPVTTGYGFARPSKAQFYETECELVAQPNEDVGNKDQQQASQSYGKTPPLCNLYFIFVINVGLTLLLPLLFPGAFWNKPCHEALTFEDRAAKILAENPLIGLKFFSYIRQQQQQDQSNDGHNDLAILIRFIYQNDIYNKNFTDKFEHGGMEAQVDLPRLRVGKVGGAFWSAFVPCPANGTDFSNGNYVQVVSATFSQLDLLRRLTASYPKVFSDSTLKSSGALAAFKDHHQYISPIGVKYATLTWNCHNAFADAALTTDSSGQSVAGPPYWGGLSERGQLIIKEMNRMGMLVDLSHVSKDTMLDVLGARPEKGRGSVAPVIFSHSSAYSLCPHPRNVQNDILELVKKTKSIVMVNFAPDFISCVPSGSKTGIPDFYPPNATLHQVARHVTYIGNLIGYDHVGLGSDFDGIPAGPKGLEDVSKYPDLVAELLRLGVSDSDAAKVIGRNILRVWADAEKTALKLQGQGVLPIQDRIEKMNWSE